MGYFRYRTLSLIIVLSAGTAFELSASNQAQLFVKCYSHITGLRPPNTHPLWLEVKSGILNASDACMQVFENAQLTQTGITSGETSSDLLRKKEGQSILRNFHSFHRTWFPNDNFRDSINWEFNTGDADLFDHSEAANHVSWILFSQNQRYEDLLRGQRSVRALREGEPSNGRITNQTKSAFLHNFRNPQLPDFPCNTGGAGPEDDYMNCAPPEPLNPLFLETGILRGFRTLTESEKAQQAIIARTILSFDMRYRIRYQEPKGAGALGTPSYLLLNLGMGVPFYKSNGGNRIPRRIVNTALQDFACRKPPVIYPSDAAAYVSSPAPHPWQGSAACMACHTTLDGGAGVFRNFSLAAANGLRYRGNDENRPLDHIHIVTHPTIAEDPQTRIFSQASTFAPQELNLYGIGNDANFHNRPPKGKFIMRDYKGELINKDLMGLEEFGVELSQTDDFYLCAASRYYGFFTGFQPSLLEVPTTSQREIEARREMIQLGLRLKSTQSLKDLIKEIIESRFYQEGIDP